MRTKNENPMGQEDRPIHPMGFLKIKSCLIPLEALIEKVIR
jgi:hypothetical protein